MSAKRGPLATARRHAEQQRDHALARLAETTKELADIDRRRHQALVSAGALDPTMPPGLRGLLASVGGRHLNQLVEDRLAVAVEHRKRQQSYDATAVRVRALERFVERRERAGREQDRRRAERDWRDLVAARASGAGR